VAFDWLNIAQSILAVLPAAAALLISYGRYDGFFKDNIIFLYFVGGLIAGMGVAIFHAFLGPYFLLFLLGVPLVEQFAKTVVINRRKWQGERHAVFNGGAYGAGMGVILSLWYAKGYLLSWDLLMLLQVLGLATGITLVAVATGWTVGAAVRDHAPFKGTFIASVASIPMAFFIGYWVVPPHEAWVPALMALYGLALLAFGIRKILPGGVSREELQEMRRRRRRGRAAGTE